MLASPPIDFHVSDTYFVVAHFHYVLFGTIVFAVFAGIYFWFPKMTGRMLNELLGRVHFWTLFVGFHLTFLVQHWLGLEGDAAAVRRLPAHRRLHHPEHDLHHRVVPARRLDATVPVECVALAQARRAGRSGRPVGLRQLTRVGHQLPAAAAKNHHQPAEPLGATGLRTAPLKPTLAPSGTSGWQETRAAAPGRHGRQPSLPCHAARCPHAQNSSGGEHPLGSGGRAATRRPRLGWFVRAGRRRPNRRTGSGALTSDRD